MRGFKTLILTSFKLYFREPIGTFFTIAFPALMVILFGAIYGNEPADIFGGRGSMDISMPGYTGMILGTVALLSIPITISGYREIGVLRRMKVTPLHPLAYISSDLVTNLFTTLLGMLGVILLGWLIYRVRFEGNAILYILAVIFCGICMASVGYLIASIAPSARAAQIIGMVLLYPMLFLSGAGLPLEILPESIQRISNFLPLTYVVRLLRTIWFGEELSNIWIPALVLCMVLAVCGLLAAKLFRWE